jgi:hypothetical protein
MIDLVSSSSDGVAEISGRGDVNRHAESAGMSVPDRGWQEAGV